MKKLIALVPVVAAMTCSAHAFAYSEGPYVLGDYARSQLNIGDQKASKSAYGVGAGYRTSEHLAFELEYKELGKITQSGSYDDEVNGDRTSYNAEYKAKALVFRAVGVLPVTNELSLEGFLGAAAVHATDEASGSVLNLLSPDSRPVAAESYSESKTAIVPSLGVGATYDINDSISAFTRYEYTKLPKMGDATGHAKSLELGLRYRF